MNEKLEACPFCGGDAVINTREYPARFCKHKKEIPKDARLIRKYEYPSGDTSYEYRAKAYIPQCVSTECLGRIYKQFETEEAAVKAWNRRAER